MLKVRLLNENARVPTRGTKGSAGVDVYATKDFLLYRGDTVVHGLGLAVEVPEGYEVQVRPRSSLSAKGIMVHFGTVDSDYRGEVKVVLTNLSPNNTVLNGGDRIAQLVVCPIATAVEVVSELTETRRGSGGFGSTGK